MWVGSGGGGGQFVLGKGGCPSATGHGQRAVLPNVHRLNAEWVGQPGMVVGVQTGRQVIGKQVAMLSACQTCC